MGSYLAGGDMAHGGVEEDASIDEGSVNVRNHGTDVTGLVGLSFLREKKLDKLSV